MKNIKMIGLFTCALILSARAQAQTVLVINPNQSSYTVDMNIDKELKLVRTEKSPKEIDLTVRPVFHEACLNFDDVQKCGYRNYICGQDCRTETHRVCDDRDTRPPGGGGGDHGGGNDNGGRPPGGGGGTHDEPNCHHETRTVCSNRICSRYECWLETVCTQYGQLPTMDAVREIKIDFQGDVATGDVETFEMKYIPKNGHFIFIHWNKGRFFELKQTSGMTTHSIEKIKGDGKEVNWEFVVR